MPHDSLATRLTSQLFAHLNLRHNLPGSGSPDWYVLDVQREVPHQLDVWLENTKTGEKAKYHVAIAKAAIEPEE